MAELAKWSQVRPCHLTGGNWNWQQIHPESRKEHAQLVWWLRRPDEEAQKVLKVSGQRGIFVSQQGLQDQPKIWWMKRQESEARSEHNKRILDFASTRSQSPVFRKGLGNDLGVPLLPSDQPITEPETFKSQESPKGGKPKNFETSCFSKSVLMSKFIPLCVQVFWNARATPPATVSNQAAWSYECEDEFCIMRTCQDLPCLLWSPQHVDPVRNGRTNPRRTPPPTKIEVESPLLLPKSRGYLKNHEKEVDLRVKLRKGKATSLLTNLPSKVVWTWKLSLSSLNPRKMLMMLPLLGPCLGDPVSSKDAVLQGWGPPLGGWWTRVELGTVLGGLLLTSTSFKKRASLFLRPRVCSVLTPSGLKPSNMFENMPNITGLTSLEPTARRLGGACSKPEEFWEKTDAAFDWYLAKAATPEYWIDGLLLQACSKKLGVCVVVHAAVGPDGARFPLGRCALVNY